MGAGIRARLDRGAHGNVEVGRLAGSLVVVLEQTDRDRACAVRRGQVARHADVATCVAVAGQQHHTPVKVRFDGLRQRGIARDLRQRHRRQRLLRHAPAVALLDFALLGPLHVLRDGVQA